VQLVVSSRSWVGLELELVERRKRSGSRTRTQVQVPRQMGIIVSSVFAAGVVVQPPLVAFCWSASQNLLGGSVSALHVKTRSLQSVPRCGLLQQTRQGPAVVDGAVCDWPGSSQVSHRSPTLSLELLKGNRNRPAPIHSHHSSKHVVNTLPSKKLLCPAS
jgi:hypothetical protein